jgi:putative ABC transport system permease protein
MFVFLLSVYIRQELSVDDFHEKKDRIYLLVRDHPSDGNSISVSAFSNPVADVIKDKCPEVESYTRIVSRTIQIDITGKEKMNVEALFADSAFFHIFSFPLLEGDISQVLATRQTAVLSQTFAAKLFPGEDPIGKSFRMGETEVAVTGIMKDFPQNTQLQKSDLVLNYRMIENYWGNDILQNWGNSSFGMYFLAFPENDLLSKAPLLLEDFKKDYWLYKNGFANDLSFVKLQDVYFGNITSYFSNLRNNSKTLVSIYLGIVFLILAVAILNYINLSISQAVKRGKESAIKKLLGSSRKALFVQFISEATIMTAVSLLLAIFLAFMSESFSNDVLNTHLNLGQQFTPGFIFFLLAGIAIVGFISGIFPALVVSRFEPIEVVKGTYTFKVKTVYTKVLISFQYIIAITLLIYSAFIVKQTGFLMNSDLGFNRNNLFVMENTLNGERLPGLRDKLMTIPGVEKVSFAAGTPLDGGNNNSFEFHGEPVSFQVFVVDSVFFDIFGIQVTPTGATPSDTSIFLNREGYTILQPDSITHTINYDGENYSGKRQETVEGIVNDIHFRSLHTPIGPLKIHKRSGNGWAWSIIVKMGKGSGLIRTAGLVKSAYSDYNGGELFDSEFADEAVQQWYEKEEKNMKIILAFTVLTLIILMMGILSMSLYYVRQKEKEIAVRKIHGSTEWEIMVMLNADFMKRIAFAFVIAVPVSWYATVQFLQQFAYKISLSGWVFVLAGIFVVVLSVVFVSIQSWRTATANPVKSLKSE